MPSRLSFKELSSRAKELVKTKPTFTLVSCMNGPDIGPKVKMFKLRCKDCGSVEARSLEWLKSSWGCMCTRGTKISATSKLDVQTFIERSGLDRRKLHLVSNYCGLNQRVTLECLRCHHTWDPIALNVQKGSGCPVCAPELKRRRCLKTHGVEYTTQREDVKLKRQRTMKRKYGVKHALQNRDFLDKMVYSSYACKPYVLGRRTVQVQGYEPQALDWLVSNEGLRPRDIECGLHNKKIPAIPYKKNGVLKVYHPDIYVPHLDLIVEVKSSYTDDLNAESIKRKRRACLRQGYSFRVMVMRKNGELVREY